MYVKKKAAETTYVRKRRTRLTLMKFNLEKQMKLPSIFHLYKHFGNWADMKFASVTWKNMSAGGWLNIPLQHGVIIGKTSFFFDTVVIFPFFDAKCKIAIYSKKYLFCLHF
jgi:hypothetical protein